VYNIGVNEVDGIKGIGYDEFVELAERSLEELPKELADLLDNVAIVVDDWPENASRYGSDTLYGLYEGVPLTERGSGYNAVLPDRITIYRGPLQRDFSAGQLEAQIRITVIHEVAHHFGFDEKRLRELGWG
jgi:predicted Zn-dependent protease with MMP-like domain